MNRILTRFLNLAFLGVVTISVFGTVIMLVRYYRNAEVVQHGEKREGVVQSTGTTHGSRGAYSHNANIVFTVDDSPQKYQKEFSLPYALGRSVKVGDRVDVFVLNKDPRRSMVDTTLNSEKEGIVVVVGVFLVCLLAYCGFKVWRKRLLRTLQLGAQEAVES